MLRTLWTAKTGMNANQDKLDAISNNIVNSTTTGYKRVEVGFKDLLMESLDTLGNPINDKTAINGTGTRTSDWYRDKNDENLGISTCSFSDIKTFYQDAYETLLSLWYIPVCMDNILLRGNYTSFNNAFEQIFEKRQYANFENDFIKYLYINNGMRLEKNQNN